MFFWLAQYLKRSWDLGRLLSARYRWTSIMESAVALLVYLPTSSSSWCHRLSIKQQTGILAIVIKYKSLHDLQHNMPELGSDNFEDCPGCGSVDVRPITAAHSIFNLLTASLHLDKLRNPSDLNLGSRSLDRVSTLNDSRLESVSVTQSLSCLWRCIAVCCRDKF